MCYSISSLWNDADILYVKVLQRVIARAVCCGESELADTERNNLP